MFVCRFCRIVDDFLDRNNNGKFLIIFDVILLFTCSDFNCLINLFFNYKSLLIINHLQVVY